MCLFSAAIAENRKEITVELQTPDPTWSIQINEVCKVGNELWVVSHLSQNSDMVGAQVISTVKDSIELVAPDLPIKHFVTGKTWNWDNGEGYVFISSRKDIEQDLNDGRVLYKPGEHSSEPEMIMGKVWMWEATITPVERIKVADPRLYTIAFKEDGKVELLIDCNSGRGKYTIQNEALSFGPLISTRKNCSPESLSASFMRDLQRVSSFFVEDGRLFMELPHDSGGMKFTPLP
jgi:heat shock protein HslJ